uniref:Protein kinase domain-containing protein n=1 Tax=Aegilops tauschii subsp. strangulata TaxID=200361 RepID=A0A453A1W9_AEGTS
GAAPAGGRGPRRHRRPHGLPPRAPRQPAPVPPPRRRLRAGLRRRRRRGARLPPLRRPPRRQVEAPRVPAARALPRRPRRRALHPPLLRGPARRRRRQLVGAGGRAHARGRVRRAAPPRPPLVRRRRAGVRRGRRRGHRGAQPRRARAAAGALRPGLRQGPPRSGAVPAKQGGQGIPGHAGARRPDGHGVGGGQVAPLAAARRDEIQALIAAGAPDRRPPGRAARGAAPGVRAPPRRLPHATAPRGQPEGGAVDGGGLRREALRRGGRRRRRGRRGGRAADVGGAPERGALPVLLPRRGEAGGVPRHGPDHEQGPRELLQGGERQRHKRPRAQLPLVVVVDAMLQIARGMEHLHSKKIYHGELNPSNVLVKTRGGAADAYLVVKVAGFAGDPAAAAVTSPGRKASHAAAAGANANANASGNGSVNPCIWYAPEVLENDEPGQAAARRTEKADVYSFGMISFELLTGKIPFEDNHLQGDNMSKNIRAGERPLFPFQAPKYLTGLTRRCWHGDPAQRPPFSSICRVLRYVKRFLVMNPEQHGGQGDASTPAQPPTEALGVAEAGGRGAARGRRAVRNVRVQGGGEGEGQGGDAAHRQGLRLRQRGQLAVRRRGCA